MKFTATHDAALQQLTQIDPIEYTRTRNYEDGGTMLSPYITRGALTLPQIRDYALTKATYKQSYKLIFELAWREYWQREWFYRGNKITQDIKRTQEKVESTDISKAVVDANTSIDIIDTHIDQLYETGYMFNHARMWVAGLVTNIAHTHWYNPSKWMYYHLLDGDPASNSLSWQWVAGTFSSKKYLPAQSNINKYTSSSKTGTFLDLDYSELATVRTPKQLIDRTQLELTWTKPDFDEIQIDDKLPTLLYHPFWINKQWHENMQANRILVLDPTWFSDWPVSEKVTSFTVELARDIPGMKIFVGSFNDLRVSDATYKSHPYAADWTGQAEPMALLFPDVPDMSYNSFTAFWKAAEKSLDKQTKLL